MGNLGIQSWVPDGLRAAGSPLWLSRREPPSQMTAPGVAFAFPALYSAQTTWAVAVPMEECSSGSNFLLS